MKRFMLFVSALAAMVLAGSCQQELDPVTDGDTTVTFTVSAGDIATKAIADGTNIDALHWEIYKTAEIATAAQPLGEKTIIDTDQNKEFNVELKLLADQDYTIIFWAEVNGAGHYNTADLRNVQINNYANEMANDESRAAFFKVYPFSTENGVAINETIELTRPFAQINLGSTTYETSFNNVNGGNVMVETTEMTVTNIATSFNTLTGKGEGEQEVTFAAAVTPNAPKDATDKLLLVNDLYYYWLGMNYLIVCGDSDNVEVDVTLVTNFGDVNHTVTNVPVKENYRTNLLGDFLTTGATFNVVIDEEFQTPDEVIVNNGWSNVNGFNYVVNGEAPEDALASILAHADAAAKAATKAAEGPVVKIDLNGDVYWKTEGGHGSSPLLPAESKISKVVINGNGNTFTATGAGVGSIRLANRGLLEFNEVNVVDKSVSYNESAWEFTYLEFAGNLSFNGCTFNSGVQFQTEDNDVTLAASFANCRFISNEDSVYAAWISDGATTFTGCSFEGTRGLKMHEAYGSEIISVLVDGCAFGPLSKKPGIAMGDLNNETSVTITNSTFTSCQSGDYKTFYETDTDVTTFTFVEENNKEFNNPSELLADAIANATESTVEVPAGEYTFPASSIKEGMTLKCADGTVFQGASSLNIKGATVEGATFSNPKGNAVSGTINGTFKDCVFDGSNGLRDCYAGETTVFENCVFTGDLYGVHFDGGTDKEIIFKDCIFSGFNAFAAAIKLVTFEGCTFKSNGRSGYNGANLWGSTKMINTEFTFDGSAANEWVDCIASDKSYSFTGCTINGGSALNPDYIWSRTAGTKIVFDGVEYIYKEGAYLASSSAAIVTNADAFKAALAANEAKIVLMPGTYEGTFTMKNNVTVEGTEGAVVDCINLNGSDNVTLMNIKFDAEGAQKGYDGRGNAKQTANIISSLQEAKSYIDGAMNVTIEGCVFEGTYTDGGVAIAFTDQYRGSSGNITIKGCTFDTIGAFYHIYGHYFGGNGVMNIAGNTFKTSVHPQGYPVYLGRYQSNETVVVTGNYFNTVDSLERAVYLQSHGENYTVSMNASNNTFAE